MRNFDYLQYTYLHRKAFYYTVNKLVKDESDMKEMMARFKRHDMDKMVMYTIMDKKDASHYHRTHQSHHVDNNLKKTYYDYMEMVIDWECAAITKPDKPLNAYDTLHKYYPQLEEQITPILEKFGINMSYVNNDEEAKKYVEQFTPVTEEDILSDITTYLHNII